MAKDPGFVFYPGDYLRDTQNLSESSQVAYDRIMCEHMRNICITQEQLNFFTKRLNPQEKGELMLILVKVSGGYQIEWVADSINKRKAYSESRRNNRSSKSTKTSSKISSTYDSHMDNEIEDDNENEFLKSKGGAGGKKWVVVFPDWATPEFSQKWKDWVEYRKDAKKGYHTFTNEQHAIDRLAELANNDVRAAMEIIKLALSNNWLNFYSLEQSRIRAGLNQGAKPSKLDGILDASARQDDEIKRKYGKA